MSPDWWELAELQAMSEHDPDEYCGLTWNQLTDDQRERSIQMVIDDSAHEFCFGKPTWMVS